MLYYEKFDIFIDNNVLGVIDMPSPKNCPQCGKLFLYNGTRKVCPDCFAKEQELERIVTDYVRETRQANVKEIVDATGVSEKIVMRMIREGHFVQSDIPISYPCDSCGKPITHGKVCRECSGKFMSQVAKMEAAKGAVRADRSHSMNMMKGK